MFGFLRPLAPDEVYQRTYSRCCAHQYLHYGRASLPFLSYEGVFLYTFCLDAGVLREKDLPRRRGVERREGSLETGPDAEVGAFCSALSLVLADCEPDAGVTDEASYRWRVVRWLLRSRFEQATAYFQRLDPSFDTRPGRLQPRPPTGASGPVTPPALPGDPTRRAFNQAFPLLGCLRGLAEYARDLGRLGEHLGAARIAYSCAASWEADRAAERYNPLPTRADVPAGFVRAAETLSTAREVCLDRFGEGAGSARILAGVCEKSRVAARHAAGRQGGLIPPTCGPGSGQFGPLLQMFTLPGCP